MKRLHPACLPLLMLWALLPLLAGCGYRAPMYKTVITEDQAQYKSIRPAYRELAALMTTDTGLPPTDGNTLSIFPDMQKKMDIMLEELRGAKESIYIEQYRFRQDSIGNIVADILKEKAADGLDVRVIVDKGASVKEDRIGLLGLQDHGIYSCLYYRPLWLLDYLWPAKGMHRDHRKIVLIDGHTGFLGGRNIQDKYFTWRDCDIRVSGPAVKDMGVSFKLSQDEMSLDWPALKVTDETALRAVADTVPGLQQFRGKTIQIVPDTPWDKRLPIRNCFEWSIQHARRYFYFYNPYTPPPASTLQALKDAAARGVDVRWIVPANNDVPPAKWVGESLYKQLLEAGVKIYEWQGNVMHTKQFITDDYLTAIGSTNMDNLSFFLNMEVEALIYDEEVAASARALYLEELQTKCLPVTLDTVKHWNIFRKFRNWFARVTAGPIT